MTEGKRVDDQRRLENTRPPLRLFGWHRGAVTAYRERLAEQDRRASEAWEGAVAALEADRSAAEAKLRASREALARAQADTARLQLMAEFADTSLGWLRRGADAEVRRLQSSHTRRLAEWEQRMPVLEQGASDARSVLRAMLDRVVEVLTQVPPWANEGEALASRVVHAYVGEHASDLQAEKAGEDLVRLTTRREELPLLGGERTLGWVSALLFRRDLFTLAGVEMVSAEGQTGVVLTREIREVHAEGLIARDHYHLRQLAEIAGTASPIAGEAGPAAEDVRAHPAPEPAGEGSRSEALPGLGGDAPGPMPEPAAAPGGSKVLPGLDGVDAGPMPAEVAAPGATAALPGLDGVDAGPMPEPAAAPGATGGLPGLDGVDAGPMPAEVAAPAATAALPGLDGVDAGPMPEPAAAPGATGGLPGLDGVDAGPMPEPAAAPGATGALPGLEQVAAAAAREPLMTPPPPVMRPAAEALPGLDELETGAAPSPSTADPIRYSGRDETGNSARSDADAPLPGTYTAAPAGRPAGREPEEPGGTESLLGDDVLHYLVGKVVGQELRDGHGRVLAQRGDVIDAALVRASEVAGLLPELIVHMTLPDVRH